MDDPDQSPLVSSSTATAAEQDRWQPPQKPLFQYQFVRDPEEEEEDEEEEEEEEVDDERLEVRERKPAAPTAPAAGPAPSLLDLGASGERPPVPPQPAWTSHPFTSSSSPPLAAATESPPPEEKPKEPPRSAPLPPPPPPRDEPPAIPPRSAPPPPKREEPPAPTSKTTASGSPDETPFALPVASDPLMHSSADKGMDSQEQSGRVRSDGHEDFAAMPLDATASLPSLSPLSANPFKEYTALETVSDGLSAKGSYSHTGMEAFKATTKNARNPFLADEDEAGSIPEVKRFGVVPPYQESEPFSLFQPKDSTDSKGWSDASKFSAYQQDSSPDSPVELFAKHDKDASLEDGKYDIDSRGEKAAFVDSHSVREEYVDFKPFEPTWTGHESSGWKDVARNQVDSKLDSGVNKYGVDKTEFLPIQKDFEKESDSSNEDISFPSTPEARKESPQAYITCAKFESVTVEGNAAKSLGEERASQNKTDEKKIAEMKAHFGTESSATHTESASSQGQAVVSDKVESLLVDAASVAEGLTPDLVQEAYESDLLDSGCSKLVYETKIDLVQMSETLQEPLNVGVQLCPAFEGGPEATPSPVLPDIVMEAPLNASTAGLAGPAVSLERSPVETSTSIADDYENVMQKSEKPPSYQEAMNVPATLTQMTKVETPAKESNYKNGATLEDSETSYISIACDLVKETKVSNEPASPAFTDYSALTECVSQPVPEYSEHLEKPSGKSDFFSSQPELDLAQKKREVVKEKPLETTAKIITDKGHVEKREDLPSSLSKPYLESFQPQLDSSKNVPATWSLEAEAADLTTKEDTPQLHMEELDTYSDDFLISKEPRLGVQGMASAESSPESDDFTILSYQTTKSMKGTTQTDSLKENGSKEISGAMKASLRQSPCQEVAQDLSLKDVHVRVEEQGHVLEKPFEKLEGEVSEGMMESLSPADITPLPIERKVVRVGKEAERGVSVKEKEKSPPRFSSQLSKPSVVDLLYWRDVKKTGVVFGASLFLLLSLTVFSIVSVVAYIALGLLSVTISLRIYKGVIQAIQKSDDGHPFRAYLDKDVAVSEELVQKYSHVVLGHFNNTIKELRRLFLVDDLVDSLKFAVLMWVFTYVGALFNGLTLMILAVISLFSIPIIYEKHQVQIDHYLGLVNKNVKEAVTKIQDKIPGLKRKTE